jgi:hypothetical protein
MRSAECRPEGLLYLRSQNQLASTAISPSNTIQLRWRAAGMSLRLAPLFFVLMSLTTVAVAQSSTPSNASYTSTPEQKAEPNPQNPATPQANNPPDSNGAGRTLGQPDPAANAALQGRIQEALRNEPTLASSQVSVNVTDTAIELFGTVASTKDKETAERIAESFDGNRKFTDKLVVTGQAPPVNNSGKSNTSNASPNAGSNNPQQ